MLTLRRCPWFVMCRCRRRLQRRRHRHMTTPARRREARPRWRLRRATRPQARCAWGPRPPPAVPLRLKCVAHLRRSGTGLPGAALNRFAHSAALDEAAARIALSAFAAAYGCGERAQCAAAPRILRTTDHLPAQLAIEASTMIAAMPGAGYAALRRRQYMRAFTIAAAVLAVLLIISWLSAGPAANAVVIAALCTLAAGALLQFYSTGPYAQSWPPLRLWPATFVGDATLTMLVASIIALQAGSGRQRAVIAIVAAETLWWLIPAVLAAAGITLKMQHYSAAYDFVLWLAPIAGALPIPFAAWAIEGLAASFAGLPV